MTVFFVNQSKTYKEERAGSYLWSPKLNRAGRKNTGYERMQEARKGDFIIHNADGIVAISKVETNCKSENKPNTLKDEANAWSNDGWMLQTKYYDLTFPIPLSDITEWTSESIWFGGAFDITGRPKQQYLCKLTDHQAQCILKVLLGREKDETVREIINSALKGLPSES